MAIQSRRGAYGDFDPDKMLPGEWASVLKDDPKAQDGKAVYMCFSAGDVKRMATYEDMKNNIQEATAEIIKQAKEEVTEDTKAAKESAAQAESSAKTAEEKASAAEKSASNAEKSAEASRTALESANKNFSDQYTKKTYKKGETCIQNNVLYEANADIDTEEDWNATHWTETSVEKIRAKMRQELDTVNTKIANITPDDTVVDGKPWTSKHIVDMLCPPLIVSGNPVQCYPVAWYPLGVTASWEPTQEGTGDPSPDNIRPIKGRDSVTVERCGENILNPKAYNSTTTNGITFTVNDDKSVHITGTSTGRAVFKLYSYQYKMSLPDGKYTFSTIANIPSGVGVLIGCYYKSELSVVYKKNLIVLSSGKSSSTASLSGVEWLDGYIEVLSGNTVDITLYPMLVPGSTPPTTYTPYTGQTNTLTLPETVYGGEVDAVSGEGQDVWKLITLNGTETWESNSNNDRMFFETNVAEKYTDLPISGSNIDAAK
jgi:hypothetical protein|nr:MAG TPA: hypothetical protein [Caudoviricetes sp.]